MRGSKTFWLSRALVSALSLSATAAVSAQIAITTQVSQQSNGQWKYNYTLTNAIANFANGQITQFTLDMLPTSIVSNVHPPTGWSFQMNGSQLILNPPSPVGHGDYTFDFVSPQKPNDQGMGTAADDLFMPHSHRAVIPAPSFERAWTVSNLVASGATAASIQHSHTLSDGSLIVAGTIALPGAIGHDMYVCRYDSLGNRLWLKTLDVAANYNARFSTLNVTNQAIYVAGSSQTTAGVGGVVAVKLNHNGSQLWKAVRDLDSASTASHTVCDADVDSSGNLVIVGSIENANPRAFFWKINGANGTNLWTRIGGPGVSNRLNAVKILPNGFPLAAGYTQGAMTNRQGLYWLVSPNGATQYCFADAPLNGAAQVNDISLGPNEAYFALKVSDPLIDPSGAASAGVERRALNGSLGWRKVFHYPGAGAFDDEAVRVEYSSTAMMFFLSGRVYKGGTSELWGAGGTPSGTSFWDRAIAGAGDQAGAGLAVAADARPYFSGYSGTSAYMYLATNATGQQRTYGVWNPAPVALTKSGSIAVDSNSGDFFVCGDDLGRWSPSLTSQRHRIAAFHQSPICEDDDITLQKTANGVYTINTHTLNDSYLGDALITDVTDPVGGVTTQQSQTVITLVMNPSSFTGTVSFKYRMQKNGLSYSEAMVNVTITP